MIRKKTVFSLVTLGLGKRFPVACQHRMTNASNKKNSLQKLLGSALLPNFHVGNMLMRRISVSLLYRQNIWIRSKSNNIWNIGIYHIILISRTSMNWNTIFVKGHYCDWLGDTGDNSMRICHVIGCSYVKEGGKQWGYGQWTGGLCWCDTHVLWPGI